MRPGLATLRKVLFQEVAEGLLAQVHVESPAHSGGRAPLLGEEPLKLIPRLGKEAHPGTSSANSSGELSGPILEQSDVLALEICWQVGVDD